MATAATTVEQADRIMRGEIRLFPGYQVVIPDVEITWHLGPRTDGGWEEWPRKYWADVDIYGSGLDPKVTWELNRCQHLQVLGRAYRLTADERYAAEAARQVCHWIERNPLELGINWWSILDVAMRAMSWAWTVDLCASSPAWAAQDFRQTLSRSLLQHVEHIFRYLEWHPRPDTHTLGEALGLLMLGIGFGQKGPARRWLERGVQVLCECARRQFTAEGVYYEGNLQYHAYVFEYFLYAAILARRHSLRLAIDLDAILRKVLEATWTLADSEGVLPEIGDDDGGRGSALDNRRGGRDVRPLLALATAYLSMPQRMLLRDSDWELAVWLLGETAVTCQRSQASGGSEQRHSCFMPGSGYAVQRAGQCTLWMRCGSLGLPPNAGHGHADLLHVIIQTGNGPQLIDAGTYTYNGDQQWRWYFRSTPSHNTLTINEASQARPGHRFSWQAIPECRNATWLSHPLFDWISAEHSAFGKLVQWRGVLFVKPEYWLIFDELRGSGRHKIELFFHFPVGALLDMDENEIHSSSGLSLRVLTAASGNGQCRAGRWSQVEGWASPGYGVRLPTPAVRYDWQGPLPYRTVTLVYPSSIPQLESSWIDVRESSDVLGWTLRGPGKEATLIWNRGPEACSLGPMALQEGVAFWQNSGKIIFVYRSHLRPTADVVERPPDALGKV